MQDQWAQRTLQGFRHVDKSIHVPSSFNNIRGHKNCGNLKTLTSLSMFNQDLTRPESTENFTRLQTCWAVYLQYAPSSSCMIRRHRRTMGGCWYTDQLIYTPFSSYNCNGHRECYVFIDMLTSLSILHQALARSKGTEEQ